MWKFFALLHLPLMILSRSVEIREADVDESTTPLSLTTADGEAINATKNAIYESTSFKPNLSPLKATTLKELENYSGEVKNSTIKSTIKINV